MKLDADKDASMKPEWTLEGRERAMQYNVGWDEGL